MFSALRTRLWMSYALLIVLALAIVGFGIIWALLQTPRLLYPETVLTLRIANDSLAQQFQELNFAPQPSVELLRTATEERGIRTVLLDSESGVLFDSGGTEVNFVRLTRLAEANELPPYQVRSARGQDNTLWLYSLRAFDNGWQLMLLSPAPELRAVLQQQFISIFLAASILALVISVLFALLIGDWIARPLQRMVGASRTLEKGRFASVPVEGPAEVQELAMALNEMSARVQNTQQSQRDFVANVSHELKTPLTSIQGFAQAILDGTSNTPETVRQSAEVIYHESNRMHRLVLDLLSLARLESGTADLHRVPLDLRALLERLVQSLAPQASAASITLQTDLHDLPILIGDGDRLAQVFTNLIDNAIKFTPAGGQVTVFCSSTEDGVTAGVQDTGKGVTAEDRARIFERFYQVDRARRGGSNRGVGLGLAIARQVILAHNGEIWVESTPGEGSRFVVKIPLAKATDATLVRRNFHTR